MFRRTLLVLVACASLFLVGASTAKAQFEANDFQLFLRVGGQDGIDSQGNEVEISLDPGSTFLGQIILRETVAQGGTSVFASSGGMQAVLVGIDVDTQGSTFIDKEVSPFATSLLGTPGFTRQIEYTNGDDSSSGLVKGISRGIFYFPNVLDGGVTEVFAGQFDIHVAPDGLPTTITFRDDGLGQEFAVLSAEEPTIDNFINFRSVTITAIPEPSSLAMLGLGTLGIVVRRRPR